MNPFENEENNNNDNISQTPPTIWVESINEKKKKKNTCVSGLPYTEPELKEHLKELKKKHGCNGSIKSDDTKKNFTLYLQGDHIYTVADYFKGIGIKDLIIND